MRRTHMRPFLAFALLLAACGPSGGESVTDTAGPMAAALLEVATTDNTFGGAPVFEAFLVLDHTDPTAGGVGEGPAPRALTDAERSAIEGALGGLGTVSWIEDADEWRTDDLVPVLASSVILGVGEPESTGEDSYLVPVSLWCGGLCGTWLTYRVDLVDGAWVVVEIVGPVMIS